MLTLGDPFRILSDKIIEFEGLLFQGGLGGGTYFGFEAGFNDDLANRYNVGVGYRALQNNISGNFNTALGYAALRANTGGYRNIALGMNALLANTDGYFNTAVGMEALRGNTGGYRNTALGYAALYYNTVGYQNTAVGMYALRGNTEGYQNTAVGYNALYANKIGLRNIALGYMAGRYELGSDSFYVNNRDRTTTADDKLKSIIYGQMADLVADQKLIFNADVKITGKTGLNNVAPVGQAAHIADPTDLATSITAIKAILVVLENLGAVATA